MLQKGLSVSLINCVKVLKYRLGPTISSGKKKVDIITIYPLREDVDLMRNSTSAPHSYILQQNDKFKKTKFEDQLEHFHKKEKEKNKKRNNDKLT